MSGSGPDVVQLSDELGLVTGGELDCVLDREVDERLLPLLAHAELVVELGVLAEPDALASLDVDEPLGEQLLAVVGSGDSAPAPAGEEQHAGLRAGPAPRALADTDSSTDGCEQQVVQVAVCVGTDGKDHDDFLSKFSSSFRSRVAALIEIV